MKIREVVKFVADSVSDDALIVTSHTLPTASWLLAEKPNLALINFNMGLATPVGLGLALALPHRRVIVLDSDGGNLLLANVLTDLGAQRPSNLIVVINDNQSMLYVPSHTAGNANLAEMAKGAGIVNAQFVERQDAFEATFKEALTTDELSYIVARTDPGRIRAPEHIILPLHSENTFEFVRAIEREEDVRIIGPGWRVGGWA